MTSTKWFPSFVGYNNKAKLKEQNSNRLTDSKQGLVVTKGRSEEGWVGMGEKGIERYYDWHTCYRGDHEEDSWAQRRQVVTLWHLTTLMGSDCNGVHGGHDNMGECNNHIVLSRETFKRVYINNTLIKKLKTSQWQVWQKLFTKKV